MKMRDVVSAMFGVRGDRSKKIEELKKLRGSLHDNDTLPLAVDDKVTDLHAAVDAAKNDYIESFHGYYTRLLNDPSYSIANSEACRGIMSLQGNAGPTPGKMSVGALCYFFEKQMKDGLTSLVKDGAQPERVGLPLADRPSEKAKLEKEIRRIEMELEQLDQEAAKAGITFSESWK